MLFAREDWPGSWPLVRDAGARDAGTGKTLLKSMPEEQGNRRGFCTGCTGTAAVVGREPLSRLSGSKWLAGRGMIRRVPAAFPGGSRSSVAGVVKKSRLSMLLMIRGSKM